MTTPTPPALNPKPKDALFNALFADAASNSDHSNIPRLLLQGADPLQSHPTSGLSPLQAAVSHCQIKAVKMLLPHSDPNHQEQSGMTALMFAAQEDSQEFADIYFALLPHSNPNLLDKIGASLLHYAAMSSNIPIIQSALSLCDPNATDRRGDTPLHTAAHTGAPLYLPLATPQNILLQNNGGFTPIEIYRLNGFPDEARQLEQLALSFNDYAKLQDSIPTPAPNKPKTKL